MRLLFCLALALSSQTVFAKDTPPENFHQVKEGLYRGAQPSKENIQWLKERGIRTIVKLDDENSEEVNWGLPVTNVHINKFGLNLSLRLVKRAIQAIELGLNKGAVYVHCEYGADRTGLIVALYRVKNGWSIDDARDEYNAPQFGHSSLQVWMDAKFEQYAPIIQR